MCFVYLKSIWFSYLIQPGVLTAVLVMLYVTAAWVSRKTAKIRMNDVNIITCLDIVIDTTIAYGRACLYILIVLHMYRLAII